MEVSFDGSKTGELRHSFGWKSGAKEGCERRI
jgi:hypothetical protein